MKTKVFLFLIFVLATSSTVHSQDNWEKVPVDQWKNKQVKQILNDSAWAKESVVQYNFRNILSGETKAKVLLRSSLPIRLAMLRERQLKKKYDKMKKADKLKFDKKNSGFLACTFCNQYYAISVVSENMSLSSIQVKEKKKFIYLENDQGVKRELERFLPEAGRNKNEQIFFFLRKDKDGKDFLDNTNKSFSFNINFRTDGDVLSYPIKKVSFNISDITRENQIVF